MKRRRFSDITVILWHILKHGSNARHSTQTARCSCTTLINYTKA